MLKALIYIAGGRKMPKKVLEIDLTKNLIR
jgi:hypothetical protein